MVRSQGLNIVIQPHCARDFFQDFQPKRGISFVENNLPPVKALVLLNRQSPQN